MGRNRSTRHTPWMAVVALTLGGCVAPGEDVPSSTEPVAYDSEVPQAPAGDAGAPRKPLHFPESHPDHLTVLTYNVRLTGRFDDKKRAEGILDKFKEEPPGGSCPWLCKPKAQADVIVFTEAFSKQRKTLTEGKNPGLFQGRDNGLEDEGYYFRGPPNRGLRPRNGGVLVGSRHPIERSRTMVYDGPIGVNSAWYHAKGAVYVEIRKYGEPYHIFGTHLQHGCTAELGDPDRFYERREWQLRQLGEFIDDQNIPEGEAIVLAGDFNIGPHGCGGDSVQTIIDQVETTSDIQLEDDGLDQPTTSDGKTLDHIFPTHRLVERVDYDVFNNWFLDGELLSDHHPLLADIRFWDWSDIWFEDPLIIPDLWRWVDPPG